MEPGGCLPPRRHVHAFELDQTAILMDYLVKLLDSFCPPKSSRVAPSSKAHTLPLSLLNESNLLRLAGISGALAVSLSAYGSHVLRESGNTDERRTRAFETGNRYHLMHSLTLLVANKARFPWLTASLLLGGMVIFSGSCYHYSITGKDSMRRYTPIGGVMYILAWLSFLL
uniref:Transmembrane protein 256 homolog n=1 Tax=Setaria digitata TaxID=48799 RepID=A0A915PM96_9BILA